jgi:hypothetical protein
MSPPVELELLYSARSARDARMLRDQLLAVSWDELVALDAVVAFL